MKKYLLLSLAVLLTCAQVFAQERSIAGIVTDGETGEPVPGANIVVKGTTTGTVTDIDGNYTLSLPEGAETIQVSFVGYTTSEEVIGGRSAINIALQTDATTLEDVVVVGYGIQEKKEITSAVQSVKAEDFNQGNIANPAQLLQGKVAGLNISMAQGGNPNGSANIRLRGLSSVGENTSPLVIVDGVIGVDLNSVDPNDIESMDVLKDGSAGAIYGTRASAGVIIVTTKSGKEGRTTVEYNGYGAVEMIDRKPQVLSASEYREALQKVNTLHGTDIGDDFGHDTNWMDEISQVGSSQTHNVAIGGGSKSTTYRASINYRDVNGVLKNTGFDQLSARMNLTHRFMNDRLKATMQLSRTERNAKYGYDEAWYRAAFYNPTAPVTDTAQQFAPYGGYFQQDQNFGEYNPVAMIDQAYKHGVDKKNMFSAGLSWDVIDNLVIRGDYSYRDEMETRNEFVSDQSWAFSGVANRGFAKQSYKDLQSHLFETTANYTFQLNRLNGSALIGYSIQNKVDQGFNVGGSGLAARELLHNDLGSLLAWVQKDNTGMWTDVGSFKKEDVLSGVFGRVSLNWDDIYFFNSSVRVESSSKFGKNNKVSDPFLAIGLGANLAKIVDIDAINNFKLRAGYGETGNIPKDPYLSLEKYEFQNWTDLDGTGKYAPVFLTDVNANPSLAWEIKKEANFGVDYGFLDDKIFGSVDYFIRNTSQFIGRQVVPSPPNKYDQQWLNSGELQNTGLEFAINYRAIEKDDFTYTTGFNFSAIETKVLDLYSQNAQYYGDAKGRGFSGTKMIRVRREEPLGQIWGLNYVGVTGDGEWVHTDHNGNGEIDEKDVNGNDYSETDKRIIGNGLPKLTYGWSNTMKFKGFDANLFFRGAYGHQIVNLYRLRHEAPSQLKNGNALKSVNDVINVNPNSNTRFSDFYVEDASYLLLDNLTIGYTFNTENIENISRCRVYVTGQNLFWFTKYSGLSPEIRYVDNDDDDNVLAPGIERPEKTWVTTRTMSLGLNVTF